MTFADPPDSNDKHMPFFGREAEIAGKLLVMNIRRLPAWALSAAHHQAAHGVYPDYQAAAAADRRRDRRQHRRRRPAAVDDRPRPLPRSTAGCGPSSSSDDLLALLDELGELDGAARAVVAGVGPGQRWRL